MKKILPFMMILLIVLPMFVVFTSKVRAGENVIFQDDFESYAVGTFPSSGGWSVVWNGAGDQYQVITDTYSHSPTKSLQLVGSYGWSIVVKRDFTSSSSVIGYEGYLMAADYGSNPQSNTASIGFFNEPIATWGRYYADIGFWNGYIWGGISPSGWIHQLQPFTPMTWYKIRVVLDKASRVYNVWVNDVLVGQNLVELNDPNEILSLQLGEGWDSTYCYFDDVKVFEVSGTPPPQGDLWIENIEPVQTVFNASVLVAGKGTILRIVVGSSFPKEQYVYVRIKCFDGLIPSENFDEFVRIEPYPKKTILYLPSSQRFLTFGKNGASTYTVVAWIDVYNWISESRKDNNYMQTSGEIVQAKGFKVLYVPVVFPSEASLAVEGRKMAVEQCGSDNFIMATFPVAQDKYSSSVSGRVSFSYNAELIREARWADLMLWVQYNLELKRKLGGYDRVVGVVPSYYPTQRWFTKWFPSPPPLLEPNLANKIGLFVMGGVVYVEEGWWTSVAHELGHSYGLWRSREESQDYPPYGKAANGYWVPWHDSNKDPLTGKIVSGLIGANAICFMGEAAEYQNYISTHYMPEHPTWIDNEDYEELLRQFGQFPDPEVLFISGSAFRNGTVILNPWYRILNRTADIELGVSGNYTLLFLNKLGEVIGQTGFNMSFTWMGTSLNVTGFNFAVPYVASTTEIQIIHNGTIVASRRVSTNSPDVKLTYPAGGQVFEEGKTVKLTWNASDLDGDTLYYSVLYSSDNGSSWVPLGTNLKENTYNWTIDCLNDGPANQYLVRIVATDGVNTGEAVSNSTFTILRHDLAVADISTSKTVAGEGYTLPINITVQNNGNFTETLHLKAYANTTLIHAQNLTLTSGTSSTTAFTWNTTGWAIGNYTLSAYIEPVAGEINTINNQLSYKMIQILSPNDIHDITITKLTLSKTIAGQGYNLNISTQILNYGGNAEDFNLTICVNGTIIQCTETTLTGKNSTTITFTWNTTGFAKGNYTIWAYAEPVRGETDTADNTLVYGTVIVTIPGDVVAPYFEVDIYDVTAICICYDSKIGPPRDPLYYPICDLDGNGIIDIYDVTAACISYGQKYP